ncbi:hypothetical protein PoB_002723800 [Plakobranchus ocellatus]|uniref:Uncharacterized protein n=1 Tax=Plakobranchus ocellatus TaxID=259542 RepID=A0AAV4A283_9GAST|nr:hypothetical protein PoB_002723800 [Plakobranchus ocellatus]
MVKELRGVTHAWGIIVHQGDEKIQTDTDSMKPPNRIQDGYLTLAVRFPICCNKYQRYHHSKDRLARIIISYVIVRLIPIGHTVEKTTQPTARPVQSS